MVLGKAVRSGGRGGCGGYEEVSDEIWPAKSQKTHMETENVDKFMCVC